MEMLPSFGLTKRAHLVECVDHRMLTGRLSKVFAFERLRVLEVQYFLSLIYSFGFLLEIEVTNNINA